MLSSPHYTALDVSGAFPRSTRNFLAVAGLSDGGLVAVNAESDDASFTYSPSRRRVYALSNARAVALGDSGELLTMSPPDFGTTPETFTKVDTSTGTSETLTFDVDPSDAGSFSWARQVNPAGEVTGLIGTFHAPSSNGGQGGYYTYKPAVRTPEASQTSLLPIPAGSDYDAAQPTAPLLNDNGVITYFNIIYPSATSAPTLLPTGDDVTALSNTFAAGKAAGGFFLYNLSNQQQSFIRTPRGIASFQPNAVNDNGVVVGTMSVYERVRGHPRYVNVAGEYQNGQFYNLNALADLPTGVSLAGAFAINANGQVVASTDANNNGGRIILLSPTEA